MRSRPVVTIDGPSGAGKTTVSKRLAEATGWIRVDTGAMYRAVRPRGQKQRGPLERPGSSRGGGPGTGPLVPDRRGGDPRLPVERGRDRGDPYAGDQHGVLRGLGPRPGPRGVGGEAAGNGAGGGRRPRRAGHRHGRLPRRGGKVLPRRRRRRARPTALPREFPPGAQPFEEVLRDVLRRDVQDSTREHSPLRVADGAAYIDTTTMTVDEVVGEMLRRLPGVRGDEESPDRQERGLLLRREARHRDRRRDGREGRGGGREGGPYPVARPDHPQPAGGGAASGEGSARRRDGRGDLLREGDHPLPRG